MEREFEIDLDDPDYAEIMCDIMCPAPEKD